MSGATDPEIEGVEVVRRPALTVSAIDMLEADGYVLGTPANLGYMSGASSTPSTSATTRAWTPTRGRPFGVYLHGNEGTEGAERGIDAITAGLGWVKAAEKVVVSGKPSKADRRGVLESRRDGRRSADGMTTRRWRRPSTSASMKLVERHRESSMLTAVTREEELMPGIAELALGAAPIAGGALLGVAAGSFKGPDVRAMITKDMDLLERIPDDQPELKARLKASIDERIDDLIAATEKSREIRQVAVVLSGQLARHRGVRLRGAVHHHLVERQPQPVQLADHVHRADRAVDPRGDLRGPRHLPRDRDVQALARKTAESETQ